MRKTLRAVAATSSQSKLAYIFANTDDDAVKIAAAKKIADQSVLADIARTTENTAILKIVIEKLTDDTALSKKDYANLLRHKG
jgi:hypothetical protein